MPEPMTIKAAVIAALTEWKERDGAEFDHDAASEQIDWLVEEAKQKWADDNGIVFAIPAD